MGSMIAKVFSVYLHGTEPVLVVAHSLTTDEVIPWGDDAVITIHYFAEDSSYGLQACDGRWVCH